MSYIDVNIFYKALEFHGTDSISTDDLLSIIMVRLEMPQIILDDIEHLADTRAMIDLDEFRSKLMDAELDHIQTDDGTEVIQILDELPTYKIVEKYRNGKHDK